MWILIFAMYSSPWVDHEFATINSQEFSSKESCMAAAKAVSREFETMKAINSKAICVEK